MSQLSKFGAQNHQQLLQAPETVQSALPDQPLRVWGQLQAEQASGGHDGIGTEASASIF